MNWILSNFSDYQFPEYFIINGKSFIVGVDNEKRIYNFRSRPEMRLLIDGYVLPRTSVSIEFSNYCNQDLVINLYEKYEDNFIHYVKGFFTIIIFDDSEFKVYGDRFAIKKYLYSIKSNRFFITNNIELCPSEIFAAFNTEALYLNCLFHHLVDGLTFFKYLNHNTVGLRISLKKNKLLLDNYFSIEDLLQPVGQTNIDDIASELHKIFDQFFTLIGGRKNGKSKIIHSITGGYDSRLVLSVLLNLKLKPDLYTYGPAKSQDQNIARKISSYANLKMHSLDVPDYENRKFGEAAANSILISNGLGSLFRTFRYSVFSNFFINSAYNLVTTGIMGGEGIRGYNYNGYYESGILKHSLSQKGIRKGIIKQTLESYYIKTSEIKEDFYDRVLNMPLMKYKKKEIGNFHFLYEVIASLHHTPDISFITAQGLNVFNPFLDYDYLSVILGSKYSFVHNADYFRRHKYNMFYFKLIKKLYPGLLNIPMGNSIVPKEYLGYKLGSFIDYFTNKKSLFPSTFEYRDWFKEYLLSEARSIEYDDIKNVINCEKLIIDLENGTHKTNEAYWHKYASVITAQLVFKKLNQKNNNIGL